jgi:hypothetical protein
LGLPAAGVEFDLGLVLNFSYYEKENPMTKFTLLGAAAIVLSSALAGPAMAQHIVAQPAYIAETGVCPNRDAGNPYTKEEDYMAWSGWRARGGWDDHNDLNCVRSNRSYHRGAGF